MSEELKPCPFCGVEIEAVERNGRVGKIYRCPNCACSQTNLERWQSRPLEDALRKQLEIAVEGMKKAKMHSHYEYPSGTKKECAGCIVEDALAEIEKIGGKNE